MLPIVFDFGLLIDSDDDNERQQGLNQFFDAVKVNFRTLGYVKVMFMGDKEGMNYKNISNLQSEFSKRLNTLIETVRTEIQEANMFMNENEEDSDVEDFGDVDDEGDKWEEIIKDANKLLAFLVNVEKRSKNEFAKIGSNNELTPINKVKKSESNTTTITAPAAHIGEQTTKKRTYPDQTHMMSHVMPHNWEEKPTTSYMRSIVHDPEYEEYMRKKSDDDKWKDVMEAAKRSRDIYCMHNHNVTVNPPKQNIQFPKDKTEQITETKSTDIYEATVISKEDELEEEDITDVNQ